MSRLFIAMFSAALLAPVAAQAADAEHQFTREGVTYRYAVSTKGDRQLIEGSASDTGQFRLVVRNGRVTGMVNQRRVSFRSPVATDAAVRVAAR